MFPRRLALYVAPTLGLALACGVGKGDVDYGVCPDYIACSAAIGTPTATLEAQYGTDGLCWDGDDDEQVLCRAACEDSLTGLAMTYPDEPACGGGEVIDDGAWGVDDCRDSVSGSGTHAGDVAADFELSDQNGDPVRLYDFCGRAVLLMADAAWNGSSQALYPRLESLLDSYGDQGLVVIVLLGENEDQQDPTTQDLAAYADYLPFDAPVLADPGFAVTSRFGAVSEIPRFVLFSDGAVIAETSSGMAINDAAVEAALP